MKKIFKFLTMVFIALITIFTLASCNQEPNASLPTLPTVSSGSSNSSASSSKQLTEAEIKENFNQEVSSVTLSKDGINSFVNDIVVEATSNEVISKLSTLEVPNTEATLSKKKITEETATEMGKIYVWENDDVIYVSLAGDGADTITYKYEMSYLDEIDSFVSDLKDFDYVGYLLNYMSVPSDFDIDSYLKLIKFSGDDFTYTDGYFVLKNEKLVNLVAAASQIPAAQINEFISTYVSSYEIKIKYDGYHVTGFAVNVKATDNEYVDASKTYANVNVDITYLNDEVSSVSGNVELSLAPNTNDEQIAYVKANFALNNTSISLDGNIKFVSWATGKYEGTFKVEANLNSVSLDANVDYYAVENVPGKDYEYQFSSEKSTFVVDLDVTNTTIKGNVKADALTVVSINGKIKDNNIVSATIQVNLGFDSYILDVKCEDVNIPANILDTQSSATPFEF